MMMALLQPELRIADCGCLGLTCTLLLILQPHSTVGIDLLDLLLYTLTARAGVRVSLPVLALITSHYVEAH
jgi:hypothetical protein